MTYLLMLNFMYLRFNLSKYYFHYVIITISHANTNTEQNDLNTFGRYVRSVQYKTYVFSYDMLSM